VKTHFLPLALVLALGVAAAESRRPPLPRRIPAPLPDHPGNIFLEGEAVSVRLPEGLSPKAAQWRMLDETDRKLRQGALLRTKTGRLSLGRLPVGWYRVEFLDAKGGLLDWTSTAVLARLKAPVPEDSPVAVDMAVSWFAHDNPADQRRFASLAALAGVNWVRDRMRWGEIEPEPGRFAENTSYDSAADIQHAAGLRVLQVFHDTPSWAREGRPGGEFAPDLRHLYRFARAMARRFRGRVQAWEPWNEANVATFGGHTVDEMCSWQKAAWLGFKAEDPDLIVCWNVVTTVPTRQHTAGLLANQAWPYYDTYNIHSYDWAHSYLELWEPARAAACGRPMWVTESDRGQKHLGNAPWFDLSRRDERLKAEYLAQEYAQSLYAGASLHFHFILGHYREPNGVQFGLLRKDFTPRPAYAALAALGRFLAGAKCLGRLRPDGDTRVIAFRAQPDGKKRDVLIAWAERNVDWPQRGQARGALKLPPEVRVEAAFDYLGRPASDPKRLTSAPCFLLLRPGDASRLPLEPPPALGSEPGGGSPCPIVLQALFPRDRRVKVTDRPWSQAYAYRAQAGETVAFRLRAYHFGAKAVSGTVETAALPAGWELKLERHKITLAPGDMVEIPARLRIAAAEVSPARDGWAQLRGRFGGAGEAALAFRVRVQKPSPSR